MNPDNLPDKDQVLDGTSDLFLGLPPWAWTIISGLLILALIKWMIPKINFVAVSVVLAVVLFAVYSGYIGKG